MTDEQLIAEVRQWLVDNWDSAGMPGRKSAALMAWKKRVHAQGYAVPGWPRAFGGLGLTAEQSKLIENEFRRVGAPGAGNDRTNIAANILLHSLKRSWRQ